MKKLDSYRLYLGASIYYRFCWWTMVTINLVYMVQIAGLDPLQMVLVGTALELSAFIFEIPTGVVADVYSRKLSVTIGYVLTGAGFLLLALVPRFEVILISQVIWGMGSTFISGAYPAWLADEIGVERANNAYLRASQLGLLGSFVGIGTSVALASITLQLPIMVGAVGIIALGIFLAIFMDEKGFTPAPREDRQTFGQMAHTFNQGVSLVRARPLLISIFAITFAGGMFSEGLDRLSTLFLIDQFQFPALGNLDTVSWWGIIAAGITILSYVSTGLARKLVDPNSHRQVTIALSVLTAAIACGVLLFAWASVFLVAVGALLFIAALRAVTDPLTTAWLNQSLEPRTRATLLSMNSQADALGQSIGGPIVGVVAKYVAISVALTFSALILLPALAIYRIAFTQNSNSDDTDTSVSGDHQS
ncbi:MAG: MFS transporter [Pseudomonadales bacterium]